MALNFEKIGEYYDLFYQSKPYEDEVVYLDKQIKTLHPDAKTVVDLGSGTGVHAKLLHQKGYNVHGIEISEKMFNIANREAKTGLSFQNADIRSFKSETKFDIALSLFHVISYLNDNQSLIEAFQNINQHLHQGGLFIFDVWYSPAVYHQKPETRVKRLEQGEVSIVRIAESTMHISKNMVEVNYEILIKSFETDETDRLTETHNMRHFSTPEIELLAKLTNFELLSSEEFLTGKAPSEDTWGVCYILKKI
ncbi:class I SAM-dependent DNA methyltransferase [Pedobacter xixiisoli]|uniref:Methyltransferase domain-containing protein n=1 Tax=Pedobacter xixiisoli TaxID=1476464 RepID=A0A286A9R4_9SPHI|nr:class I SAM-dependent methyltransferase [Pedobacter xixiisoli]SOD18644.1 Methyltransferase domain-containing protein [Pedobacter xixiisoli]